MSSPAIPVDLVIDHSIVVDVAGVPDAFARNVALEYARNEERYTFLRWAQDAFRTLRVFPPSQGHLPPGEPRVPRPGRVPRRQRPRVSRHARRHRLAHADGQRPRRARLGRRRHRGRGRDARPAVVAAAARGRRHRAASVRCRRARPRPTSCSPSRSCCASTVSSASSSSSTARVSAASRSRTGRRSATCRPSTARRARSSRSTTRRLRYLRATGRPDDLVALVETYAKEQGLWHDPAARPVVRRDARARPVDRRAVARGPGAPAGPRAARRRAASSRRRCSRSGRRRATRDRRAVRRAGREPRRRVGGVVPRE